jgi:type II secretory pathway component PulM
MRERLGNEAAAVLAEVTGRVRKIVMAAGIFIA